MDYILKYKESSNKSLKKNSTEKNEDKPTKLNISSSNNNISNKKENNQDKNNNNEKDEQNDL